MSYSVKLTPIAEEDLKRMPREAAVFVVRQLAVLAQYPTALSDRSYFPYPPTAQLYSFDRDLDASHREFYHILFKYGSDERTLFILGIARQVADFWWGKEST